MSLQKLSLKTSTVVSVMLIGTVFIALSWMAGSHFRSAALEAQVKSLSRIIEVASKEVLREMHKHAISLGSALNSSNQLNSEFHHFQQSGDAQRFSEFLNDPFITGFAGFSEVELRKLRVYDLELQPLLQSSHGISGINHALPAFLQQQAARRRGVERLKAIGGLWLSEQGPLYSILLPVGGLRIAGYIEIIFNPRLNLMRVSEITDMPITIHTNREHQESAHQTRNETRLLPIEFSLVGKDGKIAYHLIGLENIDKLNDDMLQTQIETTAEFLLFIFVTLLFALWLLRVGLFSPLRNLLRGIEEYSHGNLDTRVRISGLSELRTIGNTFNNMLQRICDDIRELERHSTIDGLTGLSNRRYFENCLEHEWHRAMRLDNEMSLLFIDIDYFKKYNDHYGHLGGDDCLRQVAETIGKMAKRNTDVTARYGGEEFVVLLPDTDQEHALQLANTIQQAIAEGQLAHAASEVKGIISLSIGVATVRPQPQQLPTQLVEAADKALYQAKEQGRDRIVVAPQQTLP